MRTTLAHYPQRVKAVNAQSLPDRDCYVMSFQVSAAVLRIRYEEVEPGS
jgi:hypothetical protein